MLAYEVDEVMTSLVTLQISADDIILIYNRFDDVTIRGLFSKETVCCVGFEVSPRLSIIQTRRLICVAPPSYCNRGVSIGPWALVFNPLSPGINLQILLLCFHTFLTELVRRGC